MHTTDTRPGAPLTGACNIAGVLRAAGLAAIATAALIFMLQGFENIALAVRPWFYLAFTAAMLGCGALSLRLFGDARGARLFMGLAVAMAPVQFMQLGGMIHALAHPLREAVPALFLAPVSGAGVTLLTGAASLILLAAGGYAGLRVLARPHARVLMLGYLASCSALLLPARASLGGTAVIAVLAIVLIAYQQRLFRRDAAFTTAAGIAVRLLFMLPLLLCAARNAFYFDTAAPFSVLAGSAGALLLVTLERRGGWAAETLRGVALALLALAWLLVALDIVPRLAEIWPALVLLLPIAGIAFAIAGLSPASAARYRGLGGLLVAGSSTLEAAIGGGIGLWLTLLALGLALAGAGAYYGSRLCLLLGVAQSVLALVAVAVHSLWLAQINGWLLLAIGGAGLMLAASAAERYRAVLLGAARRLIRGD